MTVRSRLTIQIVVVLVWLAGLAAYPLLESTEGRYASISWGMAHGESWVEPTFNGSLLFSKPPLAYWTGALALAVLPDTVWAVRLPATIALLICFLLTRRLGVLAGLSRARALWAGVFAILSPLAFVQGHMTTGDVLLWAGVLLCLWGLLDSGLRSPIRSLIVGFGLAVGFLAKGHIVLLWVVLPVLVGYPVLRGAARPFRCLGHPLTLLVFLTLTVPWFAVVLHRHHGLAGYWLGRETVDRFLTTTHGRQAAWWYFLPQVPLLMLPWLVEWWRGLARMRSGPAIRRLWLAMILVPLVVFSFSGSKRPNYLLPMVTPMALIAAAGIGNEEDLRLRRRTGLWLAVLLAAPFLYGATGSAPGTGSLVRAAARSGHPLATFGTEPSTLAFYNGGRVPVVRIGDANSVRRLAGEGYVFLARRENEPDLVRDLRGETTMIAEHGAMIVLGSGPRTLE